MKVLPLRGARGVFCNLPVFYRSVRPTPAFAHFTAAPPLGEGSMKMKSFPS